MWEPFKSACQEIAPQALIAIDRFHATKVVYEALDNVRKRARSHVKSKVKKERLFKDRDLIQMGAERLTPEQAKRLWETLSYSKDLKLVYEFKELFRAIYEAEDYQNSF